MFLTSCTTPVEKPRPSKRSSREVPARFERHQTSHDGRERYYDLYEPSRKGARQKLPMVIVLHGAGQTPDEIVQLTRFNKLAERERFVVVYPAGTGHTPERLFWNVLLSQTYATSEKVDDPGFLDAVVTQVMDKVSIDRKRIYVAGFSQGGMLGYRLMCGAGWSKRLAGVAVVGATMTVAPEDCTPARNVPLLSIHGLQDPFNNFAGGIGSKASRNDRVARPGVYETIDYWADRGGFTAEPDTSESRGQAACRHFVATTNSFEIISWEIMSGGHTWPGSPANLPAWMVGDVNFDIDATSLIWNFFQRHSIHSR